VEKLHQLFILAVRFSLVLGFVKYSHTTTEGNCNSVKRARGAHFSRLSKTGLKGAGSHANSGRNRQRRFMRLKVRQRKIGNADC
jgi:hypothetical protein